MDKEWDLRMNNEEMRTTVEIDIRKILEQLGIARDKWPEEWFGSEKLNQETGNLT